MNEFCGVFPATITPMKPDGELDETTFRQILEFNIQAGVHGFWLAGGTGESILLDDEENQRIAKIAVDQVRGRVTTIMHVGAPTTSRGAKLAQHAARVGIDSICCLPPFPYGQTDQEIVEHLRVIAAAADLPFFVYNVPTLTGIEVTPELMTKIQESVPKLVGLKHSAFNLLNVQIFAKMGLSCLIGFGFSDAASSYDRCLGLCRRSAELRARTLG